MKAYKAVAMYKTADNQLFDTEKQAIEHAENEACEMLDALLQGCKEFDQVKSRYGLVKFLVQNSHKVQIALKPLYAFEEEDDEI